MAKNCGLIAEDYVRTCLDKGSAEHKSAGNFWLAGRLAMSYNEPIACYRDGKFYITAKKFSRTTSTHTAAIRRAVEQIAPGKLELTADVTAESLKPAEGETAAIC